MQSWLDDFYRYLQIERQLSPHSVLSYQHSLGQLLKFMQSKQLNDWQQLTESLLREYLNRQHARQLSGRSLAQQLSAFRGFYRYLRRQGRVQQAIEWSIRLPKSPKKLPNPLDVDQLSHMLDQPVTEPLLIRDHAILELFYSCGLRLSELVALNLNDVPTADAELKVMGKGKKQRLLPVGRAARQALADYLKIRPSLARPEEPALFVNRFGERLGQRGIQLRLKLYGEREGLPDKLHPHRLRHSFASHLLESSQELRAVQELLGHENLSTTQVYTHLDFQHLAKVYDSAHPRAKRRRS